jgi:hypothetical protein
MDLKQLLRGLLFLLCIFAPWGVVGCLAWVVWK